MEKRENNDKTHWGNFLNSKLERLQDYHNHKENMVNAGFLVQLTLFSTIIMRNIWPPQWMKGIEMVSGLSTLIVYIVFWYLIHNFIGWQLQNKRVTSLFINGYEKALVLLMFSTTQNFNKLVVKSNIPKKVGLIERVVGRVFPLKKITIKYDMSPAGLPGFIASELNKSFLNHTGAMAHEKLLMLGSLLMLILSTLRMLSYMLI